MGKDKIDHIQREFLSQWSRPYRLTTADFAKDGDGWTCSHQGLVAHGETPAMAAENFDHLWTFGGPK